MNNLLAMKLGRLFIVSLMGLPILPAMAQRTLDLESAINAALVNNPSIKAQALGQDAAELSKAVVRSDFQLVARPEAGVRVASDGDASDFYGVRLNKRSVYGGELNLRLVNEGINDSARQNRLLLELSQPLFRSAGRLVNEEPVVRARQSSLTAQRDYHRRRSALVVSVVEAYEQVLRLEQQLRADTQAEERSVSLFKLSLAKEKLGRTTRVDSLRARLQQGEARSRTNNTREQLGSSRRALLELLGDDNREPMELAPTELFEIEDISLDRAVDVALMNRLDYAQTQQQYEDSRRAVDIARRYRQPDLRLVARFQQAEESLFYDDQLNPSRNMWTLGLSSNNNSNFRRESLQYKQSVVAQSQAMENIRQSYLAVSRDVEQKLLAYQRAHGELAVLENNFELAEARLRLTRKLFQIGRMDGFSVSDAEQSFFLAQRRLLTGRSEASVSGYRALDAMGTLLEVPPELKPGATEIYR